MTNSDMSSGLENLAIVIDNLNKVSKLPTEIGDRVRWRHNDQVWERIGGNEWQPIPPQGLYMVNGYSVPSMHIITYPFERVIEL